MSRFLFSGTGNIIFGALKIGKNNPEITNLEFENHENNFFHVFLPTEQAGTNICSMVYQNINFKICLSLFGWKENILPKQHIVHCSKSVSFGQLFWGNISWMYLGPDLIILSFLFFQLNQGSKNLGEWRWLLSLWTFSWLHYFPFISNLSIICQLCQVCNKTSKKHIFIF